MPQQTLTPEILAAALEGLEGQRRRVDEQIAEIRRQLRGGAVGPRARSESAGAKREVSAAARKRMAIAQKKRWAAVRRKKAEESKAAE